MRKNMRKKYYLDLGDVTNTVALPSHVQAISFLSEMGENFPPASSEYVSSTHQLKALKFTSITGNL